MSANEPTFTALIEAYEQGGRLLQASLDQVPPELMDERPGPGAWSIRELVVHLMDSDAVGIIRMKRVIAEDDPHLDAYDQDRFVERVAYGEQSVEDAVTLFELGRAQFARVLRTLDPAASRRTGMHEETGRVTLGGLLAGYVDHLDHHLEFLRAKCERLGIPSAEVV